MKRLLFFLLPFLLVSCDSEQANQRGFVISQTHDILPENSPEQIQP